MDKNTTKRFKNKVYSLALADANRILDAKGERMKVYTQLLLWGLLLALIGGLAFFGWSGSDEAFTIVLGSLVIDIILLAFFYFYPRVLARFNMWKTAARMHGEMGGFNLPNIKVDVHSSTYDGSSHASIYVTNDSKYPIKDCFFKIVDIKPPMITHISEDVLLEWTAHFTGRQRIEIGINDGMQTHIAVAMIVSWFGEKKDFIFTTNEVYNEHRYIGIPQRYKITLEFNGVYLWQHFKQNEVIEIEPKFEKLLADSGVEIRKIER